MAAEKTRRKLFKVAKELNLSHQTIIEFLEKKGYAVSGLNTPITDEMHDEILKRFAQEKVKADKIAKRREEIAKERIRCPDDRLGRDIDHCRRHLLDNGDDRGATDR